MKKWNSVKEGTKYLKEKIKDFFVDESGGNLVEYALLIGLALFIFFIIVGVLTSLLDWPLDLANNFWEDFGVKF
ncbi:MAG: Flp family type IVb pilin [Candidatus Hermodarchaeota archaeon]